MLTSFSLILICSFFSESSGSDSELEEAEEWVEMTPPQYHQQQQQQSYALQRSATKPTNSNTSASSINISHVGQRSASRSVTSASDNNNNELGNENMFASISSTVSRWYNYVLTVKDSVSALLAIKTYRYLLGGKYVPVFWRLMISSFFLICLYCHNYCVTYSHVSPVFHGHWSAVLGHKIPHRSSSFTIATS